MHQVDVIESCLYPQSRWCGAVVQYDDDSVTVCARCTNLLDLTIQEVVGAHLEQITQRDEVMVEDRLPAGEVVGHGPLMDAGDVSDFLHRPPLFPHEGA